MSETVSALTPGQSLLSKFLFVEVTRTGKVPECKDTRTAIQKHVMRGPKKRRGRAKLQKPWQINKPLTALTRMNKEVPRISHIEGGTTKERREFLSSGRGIQRPFFGGSRLNPFARYPIDMNLDSLFLIDYVYTCPDIQLAPFRDCWLPISFGDPASFLAVLSQISLHIATLRSSDQDAVRAIKYHSTALNSVNKRILDPVLGISDGIVLAIIEFACFSHEKGLWGAYKAHVKGLKAIFRLRGGIHTIDHNRILRLLLSGVDVATSCFQNKPVDFPPPLEALQDHRLQSLELPWPFLVDGFPKLWVEIFPRDPSLSLIFADMCAMVMVIRSELPKQQLWHSRTFVQQCVNPLTYRFLESSIERDEIGENNFMYELCRLAGIVFLAAIRRNFTTYVQSPRQRRIFTGVEQLYLKRLMKRYFHSWTTFRPLLLWICVIAGTETKNEEDKAWWAVLVSHTAHEMAIEDQETIMMLVSNLLWVGEVLDTRCKEFLSMTTAHFTSSQNDFKT